MCSRHWSLDPTPVVQATQQSCNNWSRSSSEGWNGSGNGNRQRNGLSKQREIEVIRRDEGDIVGNKGDEGDRVGMGR